MSKKLIYLISFVLLLGLVLTSIASAADPNLTGWWKLNETDTSSNATVYDSSGNGLNGQFRWGATNVPDRYGELNHAKYFNGLGQYVKDVGGSPPSLLLNIQEQITMSFWFRGGRNPENPDTWEAFISKGDNAYRVSRSQSGPTLHVGLNGTSQQWFDGMVDVNNMEWHHVCATYDGARAVLYVDGVLDTAVSCTGLINADANVTSGKLFFGANSYETGRLIRADLDNIRIYSRAVNQAELVYVAEEWYPYAYDPTPADEAVALTRTPMLEWRPGDSVVSHKVYLDAIKANVATRSGCLINGVSTTDPCYPVATPLTKGTTYYWVVDEVQGPNTWKGVGGDANETWSFYVAADNPSRPDPCDGDKLAYRRDDVNQTFGSIDVLMRWTQGMSAAQHKVYFDTFSPPTTLRVTLPVEDTNVAISELLPSITPQYGTRYYWQIVEVNGASTWPGDVWSFTIITADLGLKGEYHNNTEVTPPPVLTRKDLNIDFDWGTRSPSPDVVNPDSFSVRWTGELEVPDTDAYTFSIFALGEDGIRFWVKERQYIDSWTSFDPWDPENQPTINLDKGRVPIRLEFRETAWGASCKLFWKTPSMPEREVIPIGAFYLPVKAWSPNPQNEDTDVRRDPTLSWSPGEGAATHDVYFGTDFNDVNDANSSWPVAIGPNDPNVYKGRQSGTTYKPAVLEFDTTYYWRIDEVNLASVPPIWRGNVWSFTTGNFLVVDDFESYNPSLANVWKVGGNAKIGLSTDPAHESSKAMAIDYNNTDSPYYSEADANTTGPNCLEINDVNWLKEGMKALSLWFQGYPDYRGSWSESGGTHTIIADGEDIGQTSYGMADQFGYVYKPLPMYQIMQITAKVLSIDDTSDWAKAGVMIRRTLEPNSINAAVVLTPGSGVSFQYRKETGGNTTHTNIPEVTTPHWVRLTLDISESGYDKVIAEHANDVIPPDWEQISTEVLWDNPLYRFDEGYIGLCATSNSSGELCRAKINDVTMDDGTGSLTSQEIGIPYNAPEPMYVILQDSDSNGIVYHPDPYVTQTEFWTEWRIDLNDFRVQGVDLNDVQRMYIGFGDPCEGGSGRMYIDDIRLYPSEFYEPESPEWPPDLVRDGVIDWEDVNEIASNWLITDYSPANLYPDSDVVFDEDTFNVEVIDGNLPSGVTWTPDPCGYNNGTWYYYEYPLSGWWNVWFYNAPYDPNRWKEIEIELTVEPIVQGSGANAEIIVGGSTAEWAATPYGSIRPPLPSDVNTVTESLYIDRGPDPDDPEYEVFSGALTRTRTISTTIAIPDYNPEWVFIDVRGFNFRIVNGRIRHRCRYDIVNFRDFAVLGRYWGDEQPVWPIW